MDEYDVKFPKIEVFESRKRLETHQDELEKLRQVLWEEIKRSVEVFYRSMEVSDRE